MKRLKQKLKSISIPSLKTKIKDLLYATYKFLIDWRMAMSFFLAWLTTNGWSYTFIIIGYTCNIEWMFNVGILYQAFLWLPCTPEKVVTIPLAIFYKKLIFKRREVMETTNIKIVEQTFKEIRNGVVPTMGAKGMMAVIQDEFSRPILTDDGVTVAKEYLNQSDTFKKMVAMSMIEASANTEKTAFDGTTLTILLTDEFFKAGLHLIKHKHMHPQVAADFIQRQGEVLRVKLLGLATELTSNGVKNLGTLTTKMPLIGDLVYEAYKCAGKDMDIVIEHDRKEKEHKIEYTNGMILDAGYYSESLKTRCNEGDKAVYKDANIAILSEGVMTPIAIRGFFESIPADKFQTPFVFIIDKGFDPETMRILMDVLVQNKMTFMFVFLNEANPEELFLDIAAKTGGMIQDASFGTSNYTFNNCGFADEITIEQDKTTIISVGNKEDIERRINAYEKELKENEYTIGYNRENIIYRRKANLNAGVTKIKLACPTVTEYMTIRLKLDDAIGAVKCALKHGIVPGGGKSLWLLSDYFPVLKKALQTPTKTILKNAGYKLPKKEILNSKYLGLDVRTGKIVDYYETGIMDSFDSVDRAIQNALSIATQYLRTYILIKK
jgi:chaperonin GroEL